MSPPPPKARKPSGPIKTVLTKASWFTYGEDTSGSSGISSLRCQVVPSVEVNTAVVEQLLRPVVTETCQQIGIG